jgi:hypothetical protein
MVFGSVLARSPVEELSAMRRFSLGSAADRKIVVIELDGARMSVVQMMPDGSSKRNKKELSSEAEAQAASERMARELISRGFVEQVARGSKPTKPGVPASKPAAPVPQPEEPDASYLFADVEAPVATVEPVLSRLSAPPATKAAAETAPKKKKKSGKKKKKANNGDALAKRVLAGAAAFGALLIGFFAYMIYDGFLKPPTIVGTWRGSMIEFETGHAIIHTRYDLILDEKKRAEMTLQEKYTSVGTYSLKGNRLKLSFKDDDGESTESQYKIALGRSTLDLLDPETGKLVVQLIRFREKPVVGGKPEAPPAPTELAAGDADKIDKAADERLASVDFSSKDSAFKIRYPQGWESDTGSRPDNTYSWATVSHDSAKIRIIADIKGSLMSGSDASREHEEGSESAPVHVAHELYKKTAAEDYGDFNEGKPAVFKGSQLGEGRISVFTAAAEGLFGSKLRGYHVTLLTRDRRVTILCHCPEKEFAKLKPTFLAVCRSLSR